METQKEVAMTPEELKVFKEIMARYSLYRAKWMRW